MSGLLYCLVFHLFLAFCGDWGNEIVQAGFTALEAMPTWYQYSLGGIVSASIGMRSVSKFFTGKKVNGI